MSAALGPQSRDERLNEVLLEYVEAVEAGARPNRSDWLSRHTEFAAELSEFFTSRDQVERLTAPIRAAVRSSPRLDASHDENGFASFSSPPTPGKPLGQLGDFQLLREIGRGGMGIVYEAVQISLNRPVALKVLPFAAALDPKQLQRFKHEAQASALLHHTNIVPVHAVGCERGVHYYAMQLINGQSLAAMITVMRQQARLQPTKWDHHSAAGEPTGPLTPQPASSEAPAAESPTQPANALSTVPTTRSQLFYRTAGQWACRAAQALEHAHSLGVIHRDIKPANLLVDITGNLWITDFGLAMFQSDMGLTMTGEILGTLRYMSPEQALAKRGLVDHRTDIYSLGVTLYELLTLHPAFSGTDRQELLHQITNDDPRPLRRIDKNIPIELETIVMKATAKQPAERYATAQEFADDLQRFLDDKPVWARRPSLVDRAAKWAKRHRSLVTSAVVLLAVAGAGSVVFNVRLAQEEAKTKKAYADQQEEAREAKEQRDLAEASFQQARRAVDFFAHIGEELPDTPALQGVRRKMLEEALAYYQSFINQHQDDSKLKAELAESFTRLAKILDELGKKPEAIASAEKARQMHEQLWRTNPSDVEFQRRMLSSEQQLFSLQGCSQLVLLTHRTVRDELGLSDEQVAQIGDLSKLLVDQRRRLRELPPLTPEDRNRDLETLAQENRKRVSAILRPEQSARLKEINLQVRGPKAFRDKEVAEALGLTLEQRERIEEILREGWGRRRSEESRKRSAERIIGLLDAEQQARWRTLIGEPLKEEIRFGPPEPVEHWKLKTR